MINNVCIYCRNNIDEMSKEHAIPRSLFNKSNRVNLISVPCCKKCNISYSNDVEEFKIFLIINEDIFDQETAKELNRDVERALARKQKTRFRKKLFENSEPVFVSTPLGLELKHAYEPNIEVIRGVIQRIVSCLYFHEFDKMIPLGYQIIPHERKSTLGMGEVAGQKIKEMEYLLKNTPIISIGNETFKYQYALVTGQEHASLWKIVFYNVMTFWITVFKMPEENLKEYLLADNKFHEKYTL